MKSLRKSRHFYSLPVVTLEEGKEIGHIKGIVIDPEEAAVVALIIQKSGPFSEQKAIPYSRVVSVGDNAITIQKATSVEKVGSLPHLVKLMKDKINLRGARVITEGGAALGYVDEYLIDTETGKITSFEISGKFGEKFFKGKALLPAGEVRTIGKDVLVVRNGTEETLTWNEGAITKLAQKARQFRGIPQKKDDQDE
ncbi:MAG TPA: photosystem reaction center subunit H [Peptococcaceae bacterium]|nr:photosystem reaction center subunit H [Peptococcaceae bacterium]